MGPSLSLFFIFLVSNLGAAPILILHGTPCCGKTSIAQEVVRRYPNWVHCQIDYWIEQMTLEVLAAKCPQDFNTLLEAVEEPNRYFSILYAPICKPNISANTKKKAFQAASKLNSARKSYQAKIHKMAMNALIEDAARQSNNGKKVIVDTVITDHEQLKEYNHGFKGLQKKLALVYCPFDTLLEHVLQRNAVAMQTGDLIDYRSPISVLSSFSRLFVTNVKSQIAPIDRLLSHIALETIHRAYQQENFKPAVPMEVVQSNIFTNFNLKQHEEVALFSLIPYDFILRTDRDSSADCSLRIVNLMN